MRVPTPRVGPFRIRGVDGDEMDIRMDTEFHGLGVHINYAQIGNFEARIIHCTTPIEDEVTEWTVCMYMEPRKWKWSLDVKTFMNLVYPWAALAQTYYLHTQDRRAFFQAGEYRFYEEVPKGFEKVNMFRRWIHEELLGEKRPEGKYTPATTFVPRSVLVESAQRKTQASA